MQKSNKTYKEKSIVQLGVMSPCNRNHFLCLNSYLVIQAKYCCIGTSSRPIIPNFGAINY
jgi:hypothetical protein